MRRPLFALGVLAGCAPEELPGPAVVDAREIGVLGQSDVIEGRDGGVSAQIWDRSVWTFGDTVLRVPDVTGQTWHHNSYAVTSDLDASDGIDGLTAPEDEAGAPVYLIPPTPTERAFNDAHAGEDCAEEPCGARYAAWPSAPVYDPARDRALIFYGLIYGEPGEFNFHGVGSSIAIWDDLDAIPHRPEVDPDGEHPTLIFGRDDPSFGIGPFIEGDHLHSFACDKDGFAHVCRLGRVRLDEVLDRDAWQMWNGEQWVGDLSAGAVLFEGAPIVSISRLEATASWLAVYSPPFDPTIVARTAPGPTGPWSAPSTVYRVPAEEEPPYDALHHAELAQRGGLVQYVTYSRRTTGWFGSEFPIIRIELAEDES